MKDNNEGIIYYDTPSNKDWVFSYRHKNRLERLVEDVRLLRAELKVSKELVRSLLEDNKKLILRGSLKERRKRAKK